MVSSNSEPGAAREVALENGAGIHIRFSLDRKAELRLEPVVQLIELAEHDIVIVVPARVTRDWSAWRTAAVIQADDDRARGSRHRQSGITAFRRAAREIVHLTSVTLGNPLVECARRLNGAERRDSNEIEAKPTCLRLISCSSDGSQQPKQSFVCARPAGIALDVSDRARRCSPHKRYTSASGDTWDRATEGRETVGTNCST